MGANDFHAPHPERKVGLANDSARNFVIKGRPATAAVEFVGRSVQGRIAASTNKSTRRFVVPVFTGKGAFRAFLRDDIFFFRVEFVPLGMLF